MIYPHDFPAEGQPWADGAYSLYRRLSLQSLYDEAELRAQQLHGAYQQQIAAYARARAAWQTRGGIPQQIADQYAAQEERILGEYTANLMQLGREYDAQQQAIHADYDQKDREYADVTARGIAAERAANQRQRDEWDAFNNGDGPYPTSRPPWGAEPASAPTAPYSYGSGESPHVNPNGPQLPEWQSPELPFGTPDEQSEPSGSLFDRLLAWLG